MTAPPPAPTRIQRLKELLAAPETPLRMALTLTLAILCGTLPLFGLGLAVLIPLLFVLRLNKALGITTHLLFSNPWTMGFIFGGQTWLGLALMGRALPGQTQAFGVRALAWELLSSAAWKELLPAYLLGASVSAIAVSALVFAGVWYAFSIRARQPQTS
jgi:uncharacterized protein (DUF2062 family)